MRVKHDRPSPMEGHGDLYRAGTQPGPWCPRGPPVPSTGGTKGHWGPLMLKSPRACVTS